jgi:hypothetical protein
MYVLVIYRRVNPFRDRQGPARGPIVQVRGISIISRNLNEVLLLSKVLPSAFLTLTHRCFEIQSYLRTYATSRNSFHGWRLSGSITQCGEKTWFRVSVVSDVKIGRPRPGAWRLYYRFIIQLAPRNSIHLLQRLVDEGSHHETRICS